MVELPIPLSDNNLSSHYDICGKHFTNIYNYFRRFLCSYKKKDNFPYTFYIEDIFRFNRIHFIFKKKLWTKKYISHITKEIIFQIYKYIIILSIRKKYCIHFNCRSLISRFVWWYNKNLKYHKITNTIEYAYKSV